MEDDNEDEDMGSLVLSRRKGEKIYMYGGEIIITITDVDISKTPPQIKLCIRAPKTCQIDREEIYILKNKGKK